MKYINRKLKYALLALLICLVAFIGFSSAGVLFSKGNNSIVTVSTSQKVYDPKNYVASVSKNIVKETTTTITTTTTTTTTQTEAKKSELYQNTAEVSGWSGDVLTKSKGVVQGPSGKESYYNLNMSGVISAMRYLGFSEEEYTYWVREDGVKMFGPYVIVAANLELRPKGTTLPSSLGTAIVCDTGGFAYSNPTQLDIAVSW